MSTQGAALRRRTVGGFSVCITCALIFAFVSVAQADDSMSALKQLQVRSSLPNLARRVMSGSYRSSPFSGAPFRSIACSKKLRAAALSRCARSTKSMVSPALSTARYRYFHSPLTLI